MTSDARVEYDPTEDARVPELCHLLSAVTNGKSVARISAAMRAH